jgi:hypothetical protein
MTNLDFPHPDQLIQALEAGFQLEIGILSTGAQGARLS